MKLNTLRPRRLRRTAAIRSMVRETSLEINDFIYPIFVVPGPNVKEEIPSMPGCYHLSVDQAVKQAEEIVSLGVPAVEIFGLPSYKDDIGSSAWDMESPVQRAMVAIKKEFPDLIIVGDVCLSSILIPDTAGSSAVMKWIMIPRWNCWRKLPFPRRKPVRISLLLPI